MQQQQQQQVNIRGDVASLRCGHEHSLADWQKHIRRNFREGRKKPHYALTVRGPPLTRLHCAARCNFSLFFLFFQCISCGESLSVGALEQLGSEDDRAYVQRYLRTIPRTTAAQELHEFGYQFNAQGAIRMLDSDDTFHYVSETHYARLGDAILREIQNRMSRTLQQLPLPAPAAGDDDNTPRTVVFCSPNFRTASHVLILIHGSGAVRAGQWARALCLNDGLQSGSVLPYLEKAQERGWAVMVLNPNNAYNETIDTEKLKNKDPFAYWTNPVKPPDVPMVRRRIAGHGSPEEHCVSVWDSLLADGQQRLAIVAHSYGGVATMSLLRSRPAVLKRLNALCFTDSAHSIHYAVPEALSGFMRVNAVNFVASHKPLGAKEGDRQSGCACVSAGHTQHEWTSYAAMEAVFEFMDKRMN